MAWARPAEEDSLYLSVLTFAEIRHGIERSPPGARRNRLRRWMEADLAERFEGRILDVERAAAEMWGVIMARGAVGACGSRP